ncbi:MAG: lipid A deacylase LpxR family protein [Alphaproteobacteria bacterium]|nr:lipid A deacylase LpxR family protein [Alphaproteobacteria bacterium]
MERILLSRVERQLCLVLLSVLVLFSHPAQADDRAGDVSASGRLIITEENDYFASHDDKDYTQGARLSYLSGVVTPNGFWDQPYGWLNDNLPVFDGSDCKRKYEWTIAGQSLFTPTNTSLVDPSLKDRPYGAWLYMGASLLQEANQGDHHTLENAELLMGVVGAPALGEITQNDYHQFINVTPALGWENQIKTEPGFVASYERKWRFQENLIGNLAVDAIPELGASGGNIFTYGEAGGMARFGKNLAADYGADRIRPSLSGTGWFDPDQLNGDLGWYLFLGTQGRAVARNIFLDGNTFESSPSVDKRIFVEDFMAGASLFWSSAVRVDFTVTERTKEFYGQQGAPNRFGGINLTVQL